MPTMAYHVMEYLDDGGTSIIGWVFLDPRQYEKWTKTPVSRTRGVSGFGVIAGMEHLAESGEVLCFRLWDYHHTVSVSDLSGLRRLVMDPDLEQAFVASRRP